MVRAVLPELLAQGCRVVHLTGRNDPEAGQLSHPRLAERPFSNDIPGLLQQADLAISRQVRAASASWRSAERRRSGALPPGG